ncbi:ABC transporter substrate-binding protein [Actinopolymorpha pittospori]|uniref:Peptide/nickel transport system substrate-binding protein n=1 Tax=Actinopolymorpha pittospori TaxID=648752 RepID=A0A927MPR8_9ACTN|nr:ABC transporter substrate-binding protein [Actinopolymorpha pittospori]MBE1604625.1 peptide/nickel transport system substrate-binding protein [Actinopolymorpha pittospori]
MREHSQGNVNSQTENARTPFARDPSRRHLLRAGGMAAAALFASGCDALSTKPQAKGQQGPTDAAANAKEAPALAARVKAGELPALGKRLPTKPMVIQPVDRPGTYGGQWDLFGDSPPAGGGAEVYYEWLVRWSPDWSKVVPNVAESWEIDDDGRQYTFHLRAGMKWSDGKPYTTEDIAFAYNDVLLNKELFAAPPGYLVTGDQPARLEVLDEQTFRLTFARPNGLFLELLASNGTHVLTSCAKHYFSQFHPKYNENLDALVKKEQFDHWYELFSTRGGPQGGNGLIWQPNVPVLTAWRTTQILQQGTRMILERNPYYWKTDPQGRQLPYLDRIVRHVISDQEAALLRAMDGDFEFLSPTFYNPNLGTPKNKPVLATNRERGNYDFVDGLDSTMNKTVIAFNLTCKDRQLREVFRNRDFRIGLSHAINRAEIIAAVYQRQGEPWQAAPRKESEFYLERLATQYTSYDVNLANQHLDKAGYTQRDASGIRLRPDGKPITFNIDVITEEPTQIDALQLVRGYWQAVGVKLNLYTIDRSLYYTRKEGNQHESSVWTGDGGLRDGMVDPRWYFPANSESNFALLWSTWFTSRGQEGEEPPAAARRQMELYDQIGETVDAAKRRELFMEILAIAAEEFYVIGTVLPVGTFGIKRNNFHNVPKSMIASWRYPTPGPTCPEQYFVAPGQGGAGEDQ